MRDYHAEIDRNRLLLSFLNLDPDKREIAAGNIADCLWHLAQQGQPHPDQQAIEQQLRDDSGPTYRLA